MPPKACAALALLLAGGSARTAAAQEIVLNGPLRGCPPMVRYATVPASLEWDYWIATGVVVDPPERAGAFAAAGAEITTGIASYRGFPAPRRWSRLYPQPPNAELRAGVWTLGTVRGAGALAEGGVTLHLGTLNDLLNRYERVAPAGVFDLRLGGGYGAFPGARSPDVTVALAWGMRFVVDRWTALDPCDDAPPARTVADATLVRLVTTLRRPTAMPGAEVTFGVEVTPAFALAFQRMQKKLKLR